MDGPLTYLFAFAGGLFPALLWLWFFLRQDRAHPEPKLLILLAFIGGMISVLISLVFEHLTSFYLDGVLMITVWAGIEEVAKWLMVAILVLWRPFNDEPIDPLVYLITAALGFAALETALFLLSPLRASDFAGAIVTTNLRFLGAALLHVISSAAVGLALAFSFYRSKAVRRLYLLGGLFLATVLHTLFNFFIIDSNGKTAMIVFFLVWMAVIVLFVMFEKVKLLYQPLLIISKK